MHLDLPHPGPWLAADLADRFGSPKAAERSVRHGDLVRIRHGVYYRASEWNGLAPEERHLVTLAAHHENASRRREIGFHYSHLSAARLRGLYLWNPDPYVHLTMPRCPSSQGRADDVRVHAAVLPTEDCTTIGQLPVTSLERTLVDSARILRRGQAQIVMDHGVRLGADPSRVEELLTEAQGKRGVRIARAAWESASGLCESPGESLLRYLLGRMPFDMPEQQVEVPTRLGRYRLDFAWVKLKIGLEFDGDVKYFAFGPTAEALVRERKRERALIEEGWILLRVEWRDLFDEASLRRRIGAALSARR
jgi:very-short-patch-repair endonuclease